MQLCSVFCISDTVLRHSWTVGSWYHAQLFRPVKQYAECGKYVAQLLVAMGATLGNVLLNFRKFIVSGLSLQLLLTYLLRILWWVLEKPI
jgi:hypothetical protein